MQYLRAVERIRLSMKSHHYFHNMELEFMHLLGSKTMIGQASSA